MTSYSPDKVSSIKDLAIVDRRHSAVAVQDEPTLIDEVSTYNLAYSQQRESLYQDLSVVVWSVFKEIPRNRVHLIDEEDYLLNAIYLLRGERNAASLFVHREEIQNHLNKLPAILDEIIAYSQGGKKMHQELLMTWALRSYIRKLKTLLNRPVTKGELNNVTRESNELILALSAEFSSLGIDTSNPISERRDNDQKQKLAKQKADAQQERIVLQDWLGSISPDLLVAYRDTEDIFAEANALTASPEDEYFLEQVNADYYPRIFEALGKFEGENSDFAAKELVVVETLKQFGIIQLGLQKIIDNAVEQNLSSIKSQTDFLRNKVLGERSFSLTPKEAETEIENSVEESQRIREELYKKHVAPQLERNREEYEAALAEERATFQQNIAQLSRQLDMERTEHEKEMYRLKKTYSAELAGARNTASTYKEKYQAAVRSETYKDAEMQKMHQRHVEQLRTAKKQNEQSFWVQQEGDQKIKALKDEILTLQTALSLSSFPEGDFKSQHLKNKFESAKKQYEDSAINTAKAELYSSPAYYRKASKDEIHDLWDDYELFDEEGY
jgi:hypothetical protein